MIKYFIKKNSIFILLIIFQLSSYVISSNIYPEPQISSQLYNIPKKYFISATNLISLLNENHTYFYLIDVRNKNEYNNLKIPTSINIPIYAIKTKKFLKNKHIILINSGYAYKSLINECKILSKHGFKHFSILEGGIYSWLKANKRLDGNTFSFEQVNKISPEAFFEDKNYKEVLFFEICNSGVSKNRSVIPNSHCLVFNGNINQLISDIKNYLIKLESDPLYIVIASNNTALYTKIEKPIYKSINEFVFFLKGGLPNYEKFLKNQHAIWQYNHVIKSKKECGACN